MMVIVPLISLLEINGTMTIIRTERTQGRPIGWSALEDWKETQDLLAQYAKLKPQPDLNVYYTNSFLSEAPYSPHQECSPTSASRTSARSATPRGARWTR